jgi:hypothetical protein
MALTILNHALRIIFLILLQCLVVNKMLLLDGLVLPWIYIFGILMLPFETPRWMMLFLTFGIGIIMDRYTGLMGLHTSACVFLGFMQPLVQKFLSPREGYEITQRPTVQSMGLSWYIAYASLLTFLHHTWLLFLEVFRLSDFFHTLLHIVLSALATLILMIIGQYLIYKPKSYEL